MSKMESIRLTEEEHAIAEAGNARIVIDVVGETARIRIINADDEDIKIGIDMLMEALSEVEGTPSSMAVH